MAKVRGALTAQQEIGALGRDDLPRRLAATLRLHLPAAQQHQRLDQRGPFADRTLLREGALELAEKLIGQFRPIGFVRREPIEGEFQPVSGPDFNLIGDIRTSSAARVYQAILQAIGAGAHTLGDIANAT